MKLSELLKNVEVLNILGKDDIEITGVNIDSRRIEDGHLFDGFRDKLVSVGLSTRNRNEQMSVFNTP